MEDENALVAQASDMLLDLIGEIAKLHTILSEIAEEDYGPILDRYTSLVEAVNGLPIEILDPLQGH